ncbi:hypothetical protein BC937DRAFT_94127 [Endogone sp. FLAS-F59071]|nr:hypothetical protein BC937DRAFT_94127 [Endogone sp. FLAS-F59071]|eukprot:RUS14251.1 hypothetical protein BC937DRAFT_94127 [Endogone sp. FLAS-F59071]
MGYSEVPDQTSFCKTIMTRRQKSFSIVNIKVGRMPFKAAIGGMQLSAPDMNSQWWASYEEPSEDDIEKFKDFVTTYKVGDIKVHDANMLQNKSDKIRILVVGERGNGKSSFIKTLLWLCGNSNEATFINTSSLKLLTDTSVLKYHRLAETTISNLFICDTPGFQKNDDMPYLVNRFVNGYIREGEYKCSLFARIRDKMDAVIFITMPPLTPVDGDKYVLDQPAFVEFKKRKRELERKLGDRPFFFVVTAVDRLEKVSEKERNEILGAFEGCVFVVGTKTERFKPSVYAYQQLVKAILGRIEEYRLKN